MRTIDFVMAVLQSRNLPCDLPAAIRWFQKEFGSLPTLKGRPAGITRDKPYRVGVGGPFEFFVRSGLYGTLSEPARNVYSVIRDLIDADKKARIPYRTMQRYTGIRSRTTLKKKLDELAAVHILKTDKRHAGALEAQNVYTLTPDDPECIRQANELCKTNRDAINAEIEFQREQRLAKRRKTRPTPIS